MARDIHNVTDDVSLVMREVIDATENAMVLETALHLNKGAKSANAKDYIKTQVASKRQLNNKLQQVANKSQKMLNNVIDNIGSYTGTDTKQLKKDTASGMKMLVRSAKSMQNRTLKKVSRLEKYATSAQFIPNLDKSIISQTKEGIDKGLPVTYKNGRKVTYKAYMEMAVRTGIQQEIGNRQLEAGKNANIVFYVVNEFGDCADDHADYQGRMYYDEGFQDFPLRDEIKGLIQDHIQRNGLLSIQAVRDNEPYLTTRPNCRHKMKPVAIDRVLKESVEDIKDDLGYKTKSYRPENYEATKEQRYNERNIRKYKQRNLTYMALYKKTNNKQYLLLAQKEKRQAMLWQKRQRQHMKANPDLFRDYERENPRVLLQDLGLTDKKIQVDPNKPPTPITNKPPQNPPVPMSATVKEHLEVPEQDLTSMLTSEEKVRPIHKVYSGQKIFSNNLPNNLDNEIWQDDRIEEFLYDIEPKLEQQGFNNVPKLVNKDEFAEAKKQSPFVLFRGYYGQVDSSGIIDEKKARETANTYRKDMEEGTFFVDNTGGAMFGRGMYFAYGKKNNDEELEEAYDVAQFYGKKQNEGLNSKAGIELANSGGVKIDKAVLDPSSKIGGYDAIDEEYDDELVNEYFTPSEKEKLKPLLRYRRRRINNTKLIHDLTYNKKVREKYDNEKQIELKIEELYREKDRLETIIENAEYEIEDLFGKYNQFLNLSSETDIGVKATMLGYDGYVVENKNFFVLLNRSKLILLDDEGEYNEDFSEVNI